LCTAAGDKASLAIAMAGLVIDRAHQARIREASQLASEAWALIEPLGDPTCTGYGTLACTNKSARPPHAGLNAVTRIAAFRRDVQRCRRLTAPTGPAPGGAGRRLHHGQPEDQLDEMRVGKTVLELTVALGIPRHLVHSNDNGDLT
jgi:hypothetical protein